MIQVGFAATGTFTHTSLTSAAHGDGHGVRSTTTGALHGERLGFLLFWNTRLELAGHTSRACALTPVHFTSSLHRISVLGATRWQSVEGRSGTVTVGILGDGKGLGEVARADGARRRHHGFQTDPPLQGQETFLGVAGCLVDLALLAASVHVT